MATTLKDVALRAGVSIKTVSNVVNGYPHVKEEMRARVQAVLEELNYQPNLPARYLRSGHTGVIALAIPELSNSYFSEIGKTVSAAATAHSYTVLLDHTWGERANELLVLNGLRPHLIDGVILSPFELKHEDLQNRQVKIPLVLLGESLLDVPYDHVVIDNVAAARLATAHLLSLGRKRIAAIGVQGKPLSETGALRLRGYSEALAEAGQSFNPRLVAPVESYDRSSGLQAMRQLLALESPPDAVFCFNDFLALGAIRALHKAGLRAPEDVAVVGFDDIEEGRFSTPSLTTIAPDKEKIGELAVSLLLGRIEGRRNGPGERFDVPFRLVVRESTDSSIS
jgi:DNA-binding LacI/PurR family transcriptional regulator